MIWFDGSSSTLGSFLLSSSFSSSVSSSSEKMSMSQLSPCTVNGPLGTISVRSSTMPASPTFSNCASITNRATFSFAYGSPGLLRDCGIGILSGGSSVAFVRTLRHGWARNW